MLPTHRHLWRLGSRQNFFPSSFTSLLPFFFFLSLSLLKIIFYGSCWGPSNDYKPSTNYHHQTYLWLSIAAGRALWGIAEKTGKGKNNKRGGGGKKKISPVKYSIKTGWMVGCRQNTFSSNRARQSFFSTFLPQSWDILPAVGCTDWVSWRPTERTWSRLKKKEKKVEKMKGVDLRFWLCFFSWTSLTFSNITSLWEVLGKDADELRFTDEASGTFLGGWLVIGDWRGQSIRKSWKSFDIGWTFSTSKLHFFLI